MVEKRASELHKMSIEKKQLQKKRKENKGTES